MIFLNLDQGVCFGFWFLCVLEMNLRWSVIFPSSSLLLSLFAHVSSLFLALFFAPLQAFFSSPSLNSLLQAELDADARPDGGLPRRVRRTPSMLVFDEARDDDDGPSV